MANHAQEPHPQGKAALLRERGKHRLYVEVLIFLVVFTWLAAVQPANGTPRMRELRLISNDRIRVLINDGDPACKGYLLAKMLQEFNRTFFQDSIRFFVMIGEEKPYGERADTIYYYAGFNVDTFQAQSGKLAHKKYEDFFCRGVPRSALCLFVNEKYDYLKCFRFLYYVLSHQEEIRKRQTRKMFERTDDEPDRFANVISMPDSSELGEAKNKMRLFLERRFNVGYPLFNTAKCPVSMYYSAGRFHLYTLRRFDYEELAESTLNAKVLGSFDDISYVHTFDSNNLLVKGGDGYYYVSVKSKRISGPIDIKPIVPGYWGEIMLDYAYAAGQRVFIEVHDNLRISYTLVYDDSTKELAYSPESLTRQELRYYFDFFQRQMEDSIKRSKKDAHQKASLSEPNRNSTNFFLVLFIVTCCGFGFLYLRHHR